MSGVIFGSGATGQTSVYAQIRSLLNGQIGNGSALEAYNQGHWANYVNSTPEDAGAGEYALAVPGYLPAGLYKATFYVPVGGSPASGDTPFATEVFNWDGSNVVGLTSSLNVGKINGSASAAVNLGISCNAMVSGAAAAGTLSTSQITTNLGATVANIYAGRILIFTSGVNAGLACLITAYAVTGGRLTFIAYANQPAPSAPSAADTFIIK